MFKCRLCNFDLGANPIAALGPFPRAAQYYPVPDEFDTDLGIELNIHQCPMCGLVQLSNTPVHYFREVITAAALSESARKARLSEIGNLVDRFGLAGAKSIDIGCGKGEMIGVMQQAGLDAAGIEFSQESVNLARSNGYNALCGYIQDETIHEKYGFFTCLNYLEHQPDTKTFIRAIHNITEDDAVGYVTVPNLEYLLETGCLYEFVADHLVYFTRRTLTSAFEGNGFDVLNCELINNANDIAVVVKKGKLVFLDDQWDQIKKVSADLKNTIATIQNEGSKVAVWGAGHRTLALLAISQIDNIEFIVDSAKFKQDRFAPITHIKIVSPSVFEASGVEVAIVMVPGIYPDEVIKMIKRFGRHVNIWVLKNNTLVRID